MSPPGGCQYKHVPQAVGNYSEVPLIFTAEAQYLGLYLFGLWQFDLACAAFDIGAKGVQGIVHHFADLQAGGHGGFAQAALGINLMNGPSPLHDLLYQLVA